MHGVNRSEIIIFCVVFSSHTRKRSRRKTREPYIPVVGDDVIKSVRPPRSRHDDVIYPSLLVDDCARAAGCRDCACVAAAAGFRVAGDALAACDEAPGDDAAAAGSVPRQQRLRPPPRRAAQLPCCVADCSCAGRRSSTSTQRKFTTVSPPFPTPPPPPPPPLACSSATSRGRVLEARSCCGVMTTASHDVTTSLDVTVTSHDVTTSFNNDLLLHRQLAVADERLHCTSTDGASCETRDVTDQ